MAAWAQGCLGPGGPPWAPGPGSPGPLGPLGSHWPTQIPWVPWLPGSPGPLALPWAPTGPSTVEFPQLVEFSTTTPTSWLLHRALKLQERSILLQTSSDCSSFFSASDFEGGIRCEFFYHFHYSDTNRITKAIQLSSFLTNLCCWRIQLCNLNEPLLWKSGRNIWSFFCTQWFSRFFAGPAKESALQWEINPFQIFFFFFEWLPRRITFSWLNMSASMTTEL